MNLQDRVTEKPYFVYVGYVVQLKRVIIFPTAHCTRLLARSGRPVTIRESDTESDLTQIFFSDPSRLIPGTFLRRCPNFTLFVEKEKLSIFFTSAVADTVILKILELF